jgi:hypothetical protein
MEGAAAFLFFLEVGDFDSVWNLKGDLSWDF